MSRLSPSALSGCVREVVSFAGAAGWDHPPHLFALVPTAELLAQQPELAATLTGSTELTPVAQDALPTDDEDRPLPLDEALATLAWPDGVVGCALVQEILVLPPSAEAELDDEHLLRDAGAHPARREARLVVGVLRAGDALCLMQLRGEDELLEHAELAPNLVEALRHTFDD